MKTFSLASQLNDKYNHLARELSQITSAQHALSEFTYANRVALDTQSHHLEALEAVSRLGATATDYEMDALRRMGTLGRLGPERYMPYSEPRNAMESMLRESLRIDRYINEVAKPFLEADKAWKAFEQYTAHDKAHQVLRSLEVRGAAENELTFLRQMQLDEDEVDENEEDIPPYWLQDKLHECEPEEELKIIHPPGTRMTVWAGALFSPQTVERIFEPIVADYQTEYFDTLQKNADTKRLRVIACRHWSGFILSAIFVAVSGIGKIIKAIRGAG